MKKYFLRSLIIVSLIEFLAEEFSLILFLQFKIRFALISLGFLFDLLFIIIFFIKILIAMYKKNTLVHLRNNLLLDLIHSLIPLLFYSLPQVLMIFKSNEMNLSFFIPFYKLRFLRLLRFNDLIIEIFYNKRRKILILIAFTRIFALSILIPFVIFILFSKEEKRDVLKEREIEFLKSLEIEKEEHFIKSKYPFILLITDKREKIIYSKSNDFFLYYSPSEYYTLTIGENKYYIDKFENRKEDSKSGLFFFMMFFSFTLSILYFSKIFYSTFLNPIIAMESLISDPLEYRKIKIPSSLRDECVFKLAKQFNNSFIANKLISKRRSKIPLELNKIKEIFKN